MKKWLFLVASLCLVSLAWAEVRTEDPAESRVRDIAKELRCAVCQNQSIYESNSDLAKDMLGLIRDKVNKGESDADIRQYFLDRYGDFIYLKPRVSGFNWIIWGGPFLALAIGGWALLAAIRRWSAKGAAAHQAAAQEGQGEKVDADLKARIKKELDGIEL